jgi:hypothetical protein
MDKETLHDGLRFLQTNKTYLGREFLTWLWFLSDSQKHEVDIPGHGRFKLTLDDKLVLSSSGGSVHENSLKGPTPAYAAEARTALLSGKLVHEAKFILQNEDKQWMWTMKAEDLAPRSVKLPPVAEADAESHMGRRIEHMQLLTEVIDHLFKDYMSRRLTKQFADEMVRMSEWLEAKSKNSL